MEQDQQPAVERIDEAATVRRSIIVRGIAVVLGLGCFAGALLVAGLLLLALLNMRMGNPVHVLVGFIGVASVAVFLIAAVRLSFHPSGRGLLWGVGAAAGFWLFIRALSLPGAAGLFH